MSIENEVTRILEKASRERLDTYGSTGVLIHSHRTPPDEESLMGQYVSSIIVRKSAEATDSQYVIEIDGVATDIEGDPVFVSAFENALFTAKQKNRDTILPALTDVVLRGRKA